MIIWLNLFSLVFGLLAWILPVINLLRYGKQGRNNWAALSLMSLSACAVSLCFQLFYVFYWVKAADWSALMDTMSAVAVISAVLLAITILLNGINLKVYRGRTT
jgi:cytochrome c oxidase subunit 4